eukprot:8398326-Karenia_brevis.AAC.1
MHVEEQEERVARSRPLSQPDRMMSHVEWATSIPDNDAYDYDSDTAPSDPDADSPFNDDTLHRIDEYLSQQ